MRYREEIKPKSWNPYRERYFKHIGQRVKDRPATPPAVLPTPEPEEPKGPYFSVNTVRRAPKIEDEDEEFMSEIAQDSRLSMDPNMSRTSVNLNDEHRPYSHADGSRSRASRLSMSSRQSITGLPYTARVHRGSWSTREFSEYNDGVQGNSAIGTRTPVRDDAGTRPSSRLYMVNPRTSIDNVSRPPVLDLPGHSRSPSAKFTEQSGRPHDPVSPVDDHSAYASPAISRASSFSRTNHLDDVNIPSATFSASALPHDEQRRPLSPINTAIARGVESGNRNSPPPSPGSPRSRTKLQRHRRGESINEE
jgi:hypothetical protein